MLRFKGKSSLFLNLLKLTAFALFQRQLALLLPKVRLFKTSLSLHLRQKTQIDCKKVSKWPAGSPESPDFMRRLPTNCGRRDVQSCSCLRSSLVEPKDLHGLKSKRQVVLVQAVRKQGVMIFQSWQCSFQQKWQILVQKVKNLPVCLHSVSSFTCQWSRSTCGCCRGTFLLPGEPSAGWCTIKYLLAVSGGQGSEHSCMLATH
nr:uncharacterized protein LOC125990374 isoform X2 [Syngnathus scovelli]